MLGEIVLPPRAMAQQGIQDVAVKVRGDNMSAMTWSTKRSFKGDVAARIAIYQIMQNGTGDALYSLSVGTQGGKGVG